MQQAKQRSNQSVLWRQVWGLAAVQGAIALTWVIYNLYLLDLLSGLGFPRGLATGLLIIENLLAAVMEPLMGSLSDRTQQWVGSRLPLIALGLILASLCFVAIPAVFILGGAGLRGLLPVALVAWALAMTVFRSPALSLLARYALATELPQAASILTLVGGVAGAMGPLAGNFILSLGPGVAFAIGSVVLIVAAAVLRQVGPDRAIAPETSTLSSRWQDLSLPGLGLIFMSGVGITLGFRLLLLSFPQILVGQLEGPAVKIIVGLIFVALAVTAIPAGKLTLKLGNRRSMVLGLVIMAALCGLVVMMQGWLLPVAIATAFGAAFSLVSNGTLPFALSLVPFDKAGLGTGLYFSGGAVASSLFGVLVSQAEAIAPQLAALGGGAAFLGASLCIAASSRIFLNTAATPDSNL
ncbi:MAG: SLC45 family MFS transporter [Leptolyngbyaceae cyanobacterium RM1_1_2]|nr:SLC45 family MFS transporter [Leptolyngbyaceae cyanobacterium RM1_1_2]